MKIPIPTLIGIRTLGRITATIGTLACSGKLSIYFFVLAERVFCFVLEHNRLCTCMTVEVPRSAHVDVLIADNFEPEIVTFV